MISIMRLFVFIVGLVVADAAVAAEPDTYLFSYFTGNGEDGLHLLSSDDGLDWKPLRDGASFLQPEVGKEKLMRDPCIVRAGDTFHMVWTPGWNERGIGYASSTNLTDWTPQRYLEVMGHEPEAQNAWAPELFHDGASGRFLIFWATSIPGRFTNSIGQTDKYDHRIYYVETRDFENFSPAKLLYDHQFAVIDSTIHAADGRFVMILKDETDRPAQKNLRVAWAPQPEGPWSPPSPPITGNYWAEGPTMIQINGRGHVYFDKYTEHRYGLVTSPDLKTWTDQSDALRFPKGVRHGTVLVVPRQLAVSLDTAPT